MSEIKEQLAAKIESLKAEIATLEEQLVLQDAEVGAAGAANLCVACEG